MATLLETLKKVSFFQGSRCPYKLLATLYHVGLQFESSILDTMEHVEANSIEDYILSIAFDSESDSFNIDAALYVIEGMIHTERQAEVTIFLLLQVLDSYVGGADIYYDRKGRGTAMPSTPRDRLRTPHYYCPTEVEIADEKTKYTIIPRMKPLYDRWIKDKDRLPRKEAYYSKTLAAACLEYHRILRYGRVDGQEVIFPLNGSDAEEHFHFLESFAPGREPPEKLTIALAPFDSGFKPELLTYDKSKKGGIPFRFVRTIDPPISDMKLRLRAVLNAAMKNAVDVIIFPELTVDHDAMTAISDFLAHNNTPDQLKLVVAGSYHRERKEGGYVNSAPMLDWRGNVVWRHDKIKRYEQQLKKSSEHEDPSNTGKPLEDRDGAFMEENIHTANPLAFVDTTIGRMATLICLDYLQETVVQAVGRVGCHYLWVPLMTATVDTFRSHAKDIYGAKYHVLSALSASVSLCEKSHCEHANLSFLYAPSKKFAKHDDPPGIQREENFPLIIYRIDIML